MVAKNKIGSFTFHCYEVLDIIHPIITHTHDIYNTSV